MSNNLPNILNRSIRSVNKLLIDGEISVSSLHAESYKIIEAIRPYNPFITVCQNQSIEKARHLDDKLKDIKKLENNPLFGIPISIKDNFCTDQILTTCASKMLHNFVPNYSATAVTKLLESNCIMMGKTNMDEFAMGSSSVTSFYGPTANTCRKEDLSSVKANSWFMAGGSSTGSAVSVASGACFASLGSDTGGSTRQPASLTGIIGFKPTYGLISRFGLVPLAHCLDVVSIFARNVDDVQLVFDTIAGQDENDLTSVDRDKYLKKRFPNISVDKDEPIIIRVGIPSEFIAKGDVSHDISSRVDQVIERIKNEIFINPTTKQPIKFELIDLKLENSRLSTECYTVVATTEISSNMSCYDGVKYGYSSKLDRSSGARFNRDDFFKANRDEGFGDEVKKRILLGNYFLMSENRETYLDQATKLRRAISDEFENAFLQKQVDVILTPSTPNTSISHQEWLNKQSDNKLFHEDYFLIPSNLANLPSISLPAGLSSVGLPIGLQLIANKFNDLDLLFVSNLFEQQILNSL